MELFWVMVVVNLLFFLWLVVAAFTRSVLWGVLVLLPIPFTAIIFGIMYFRDVKLPFLLYLATGVFAGVAMAMMDVKELDILYKSAGMMSPSEMSSPIDSTDATAANSNPTVQPVVPTGVTQIKEGTTTATTTAPATAPAVVTDKSKESTPFDENIDPYAQQPLPAKHADAPIDPLQIKKTVQPPPTTKIKPSQASKYMGRYFIVVMNNKLERCGILKRLDGNNLYLLRKWDSTGDSAEFAVSRARIKSIEVLKQGQTPPECRK